MINKKLTLRNTLPAICSAIAGRKGVKIVWNGPPRTEGTTIWSNPLPIDADEDTVKMVIGNIDHECGHIRFSDFDFLNRKMNKISALHMSVWNALEDTFDERMMGDEFLGCQQTLAESAEILISLGKARTGKDGPADALATYCDCWGRKNVLQQKVDVILESSKKELTKYIEERGVERLEALLSTKLYSASSTRETFDLSSAVIKLIEDIKDEQEEQKKNSSSEKSEKGESGQDSKSQDSKGQQSDTPNDQKDGKSGSSDSGNKSPKGTSPENGKSEPKKGAADDKGGSGSAAQILEDKGVPTTSVIDRKGAINEMASKGENAKSFVFDPKAISKPGVGECLSRYNQLKSTINASITMLQRKLIMEFQTKRRTRYVSSENGRLDSNRLHYALLGEKRIRREKKVTRTPLPAVSLVLDCSSSMRGSQIDLATQAVIALAEVCNTMNVPCEITIFTGSEVGQIKTFDEQLVRTRGRIGGISAAGGTYTAEALWMAGNRLFTRKEPRKIMMLITDGKARNMVAAEQVANVIERSGIELYGIGLGTNIINSICTKSQVVNHADDLASAILDALAMRMLRAA